MYYSEYALEQSLSLCDSTGDAWSASSCCGGVFMENIAAADPSKRDLSPTDVHYPCSKLSDKYKNECYVMQTGRMAEMGLTPTQILDECKKVGPFEDACATSLGRDESDTARGGDPAAVSALCSLGDDVERPACMHGVVFALCDNTWDGRWSFKFCNTYPGPADAIACYKTSMSYLGSVYVKTLDDLRGYCASYAPGDSRCVASLPSQ